MTRKRPLVGKIGCGLIVLWIVFQILGTIWLLNIPL